MEKAVHIFLVISSRSPGKKKRAGYRYILVYRGHTLTGEGKLFDTTGHRLVMACAVEALKRMKKPSEIVIHTDCRYLINGSENLSKWKAAGWHRERGELKNADLWQQLEELQRDHLVTYKFDNMEPYK